MRRRERKMFPVGFTLMQLLLLVATPCLVLVFSVPASAAEEAQKRVLVLYASRKEGASSIAAERIYQKTLSDGLSGRLDYYSEYIDVARFNEPQYLAALSDFLRQKYENLRFDLIIANSVTPIEFLQQYGTKLFPSTPVVFITGENLSPLPNATGVSTEIDMKGTIDFALLLQPGTKRVFVVSGASAYDKFYEDVARRQFHEFEGRVSFTYLSGMTLATLNQTVANLPPESIVYFLAFAEDGSGNRFLPADVLDQLSAVTNAPIFSWHEVALDHGIVGGNLTTNDIPAQKSAELALRVLRGEKAENIPVNKIRIAVPMFDWRQLRRWGIDESKLPAGSIVRFKEPTFWEHYKWRIVGAVSLIILQTMLIVWLLINRARRRRAEEASKASEKRYRNVVETQTELICRFLPDTTLTFVNDAYCRHFGKTREELIGKKYTQLIPEHAREATLNHIASLIENPRAETYEHEVVLPDGGRGWQQWVDNVVGSSNGHGVELQGIGRDITERRQAEVALRSSETRFQTLADSAPLLIWMSGPDKLCSYVSQGWLDFTGRTLEQELGIGWTAGIYNEDYARCLEVYESAFDRKEPFKIEYRLRRTDGSFRWMYDSGTPRFSPEGDFLGFIGSCIDIADRKEAEEALQVAHEEVNKLKNQLQEENIYLQEEIRLTHHVNEIVGEGNAIKYVLFKIEQVAQTDTSVLVLGETGTGKELVARAIHSQSLRKDRPLVKVNCAALSASLIESELFGHEKGAFTGASARKMGRFELADGATMFLDEIGELPLDLQPKLLRVIQEGELERLGSSRTIKVDVRIIAATNRNMKLEVERGAFREDLWYRLNVFPITVPPLRQRKEDIPPLIEHFVHILSKKVGKNITSISGATLKKLQEYSWPGNVRELANVIERGVINAQGPVLHIADQFAQSKPTDSSDGNQTLDQVEKEYITQILDQTGWRIEGPSGAARILGLNPSTLRTRMVKLGIQKSTRSFSESPGITS